MKAIIFYKRRTILSHRKGKKLLNKKRKTSIKERILVEKTKKRMKSDEEDEGLLLNGAKGKSFLTLTGALILINDFATYMPVYLRPGLLQIRCPAWPNLGRWLLFFFLFFF